MRGSVDRFTTKKMSTNGNGGSVGQRLSEALDRKNKKQVGEQKQMKGSTVKKGLI